MTDMEVSTTKEIKSFENIPFSKIYWKDYLEAKDYNKDINKMCSLCQEKQIADHGEITIECKGLAGASMYIDDKIAGLLSEEELAMTEQMANPYAWAAANISSKKFKPRWYQEMVSRCTSKRMSLRCGRRAGKSYSLGLRMLHRAMTTECKILVVTPYEIQAEELMNIILEFVWALDPEYGTYASVVDKFVKSPTYLMRFLNKSRIRAFTTGSSGAGSVRGQAADVIVLDEVDYMTTADFNSILAILMDNPDVELWVASTPNGKSQLHRLENLAAYKGFHFPSYVLPHYNDVLDTEFKDQFDDIGYVQEVMAEFGEADATVFQGYFIDKNTKPDLNMPDVLENRDDYIVILGGDWNDDKNGTRLLAVAFHKATKEFHVCDQRRVSKEGWTQIAAVQEIIEFNRKYDFEHIYLDEGYGTSNIQFIKQYGLDQRGRVAVDHPDIKLSDVVGINFSSKIEVIPAGGGEMIKKDMKTYLVENSVRLLERDAIKFDKELDDSLIDQMRNYVILRRSPTGKPIYGTISSKIGDHDLDAFMVALLGWSMEYSSLLTHTTSDTLVNLVSRDKMNGSDTSETEATEYLTGPDAGNELFASSKTKVNSIKLFNSKINRYNRASFSEHAGNGKGRSRHKGRARSSYG